MTKVAAPRAKTCSYSIDDESEAKKAKETKKCVIKRMLKSSDYKNCVLNNKVISKSQQRFKSETPNNKTAPSCNDDKRLQTFDRITSYPYGASARKACKTELLSKINIK